MLLHVDSNIRLYRLVRVLNQSIKYLLLKLKLTELEKAQPTYLELEFLLRILIFVYYTKTIIFLYVLRIHFRKYLAECILKNDELFR